MMSAAILITAGAEQTKASVVSADLSSDQGGPEGISFAKSFNERVGVSALTQGKNSAGEAAIALPSLKSTTFTKKLDELADLSSEVKGKAVPAREISAQSGLKNTVADKIISPQTTTVAGLHEKPTADDSGMQTVGLPAQVEGIAQDVSPSSPTPYAKPAAGATDESLAPQISIADGDRPLVPRGSGPVVLKETKTAETIKEGTFAKKTAKTQESEAAPKTVKAVGPVVNAIAVEAKPIVGTSTDAVIPMAGQTSALQSEKSEISKTTDVFSKTVSAATKPSIAVSPTTVDGLVRKEVAPGAKASAIDTEVTVPTGSDLVASPKPGNSPEKMTAVAIPGGSGGDNKPKAAPESGAALLHSTGIVPTAVVSGNAPVELAVAKLAVGDAGGHTAGLSTGSREQDGAGVVAQSMDGAPRMLAATPTSLEVGIQNGTHGWLKVRAEMTDGGVVNASVSAASSAGQEMLHRELPALTAYLQEEKVAVNAVIVHAPSAAGTDARSSSGAEGAAGGQTPQRSNEGEDQHQNLGKATLNGSDETMTYGSLPGVDEDGSLPLAAYTSGGTWLSVRA
jgi:hypothetical protein